MDCQTFTCPDCEGTGRDISQGYTIGDITRPTEDRGPCRTCRETKVVTVNPEAIALALVGRKGLRTAKPKDGPYGAAYVWRMARFHGGVDTTMPVTAFWTIGIGAFVPECAKPLLDLLDRLADETARKYCGTDMGAARRWAGLI